MPYPISPLPPPSLPPPLRFGGLRRDTSPNCQQDILELNIIMLAFGRGRVEVEDTRPMRHRSGRKGARKWGRGS